MLIVVWTSKRIILNRLTDANKFLCAGTFCAGFSRRKMKCTSANSGFKYIPFNELEFASFMLILSVDELLWP